MTTNDKTREALRQIKHSITQARSPFNDWRRELRLIELTIDEVIAALASTPSQPPVAAVPAQPFNRAEAKAALASLGLNDLRELALALRAQLHLMEYLAATPTPAPSAQGESPTRQTDLSKKLRLLYEALGHPHNVFDRRHLLQAADEIERYYGGMLAWKHTAEAKDRQLSELAALERAEVRPPVLTDDAIEAALTAWFSSTVVPGSDPFGQRMRAAIYAAHGITPPSAADSAQGGATGVSNAD